MPDPITTIDRAHSGSPDSVATPWAETRRVLETAEVFWLSTVRAHGRPHVTPVAAAWLEETLYFGTGSIAQKLKNLRGTHMWCSRPATTTWPPASTSWSKVMPPHAPTQPHTNASTSSRPPCGARAVYPAAQRGLMG